MPKDGTDVQITPSPADSRGSKTRLSRTTRAAWRRSHRSLRIFN